MMGRREVQKGGGRVQGECREEEGEWSGVEWSDLYVHIYGIFSLTLTLTRGLCVFVLKFGLAIVSVCVVF